MRYLPKSPGERIDMLQQIGAGSIDDLFSTIPQEYRLERDLYVPRQMGESEIVDYFREASVKERDRLHQFSRAPGPIATTGP